jgi:hypothetical protein
MSMSTLSTAATAVALAASLTLASAASALTYQGKARSYYTGGTLQFRVAVQPTGAAGAYAGTLRCRSLTRGVRCLAPSASIGVIFYSDNTFEAVMAGGLCAAVGQGSPYGGPLSGYYGCANGDEGSFFWKRRG